MGGSSRIARILMRVLSTPTTPTLMRLPLE